MCFSSSVRIDTPFTTESGELQLLPAGESGRLCGSPHLSGWLHYSPQSHVSCSCCQLVNLVNLVGSPRLSGWTHRSQQSLVNCSCSLLVNLVNLVVLFICQDGHTVYHRVSWAVVSYQLNLVDLVPVVLLICRDGHVIRYTVSCATAWLTAIGWVKPCCSSHLSGWAHRSTPSRVCSAALILWILYTWDRSLVVGEIKKVF